MQSIRLIRENLIFLYILQKSVNLRLINSAQRVKLNQKLWQYPLPHQEKQTQTIQRLQLAKGKCFHKFKLTIFF